MRNKYRFTNPPKSLTKAKLDNIAIVPASMLPFGESFKQLLEGQPEGGVFLCHAKKNSRQTRILERVGELFQERGHRVTSVSMESVGVA